MKHVLLLLSALIFAAPAWAADAAPAAKEASAPVAQPAANAEAQKPKAKKKAKKQKAKKTTEKAAATSRLTCPTGCYAAVCGGVTICTKNKPAPLCTPC